VIVKPCVMFVGSCSSGLACILFVLFFSLKHDLSMMIIILDICADKSINIDLCIRLIVIVPI